MFEKLVAAIFHNNVSEVRELIKKDKSLIMHVDAKGSTPLHYAVHLNKLEVMNELISLGAVVDQQDKSGRTALHWGVEKGVNLDIIESLIEKGADINIPSGVSKNTPLHYAAQQGNVGVMKVLVERGANIQVVNSKGQTCLDVCKDSKTGKALGDLLREQDAKSYQGIFESQKKGSSQTVPSRSF